MDLRSMAKCNVTCRGAYIIVTQNCHIVRTTHSKHGLNKLGIPYVSYWKILSIIPEKTIQFLTFTLTINAATKILHSNFFWCMLLLLYLEMHCFGK